MEIPVDGHACEFEIEDPECGCWRGSEFAVLDEREGEYEVLPGKLVEVEPGEEHYGVVGVFLDADEKG